MEKNICVALYLVLYFLRPILYNLNIFSNYYKCCNVTYMDFEI
jgi:hypothetical protein